MEYGTFQVTNLPLLLWLFYLFIYYVHIYTSLHRTQHYIFFVRLTYCVSTDIITVKVFIDKLHVLKKLSASTANYLKCIRA